MIAFHKACAGTFLSKNIAAMSHAANAIFINLATALNAE